MQILLNDLLKSFVSSIECTDIPGVQLQYEILLDTKNLYEIRFRAALTEDVAIGDWRVVVSPAFQPDFYYASHLTPYEDSVIDMHVFRTPAMMMGQSGRVLCVLPVTDGVRNGANRRYMDLDALKNAMTLGITTTELSEHVLYRRTDRAVLPAGAFTFSLRILLLEGDAAANPYRSVLADYWKRYGEKEVSLLPPADNLMKYVEHTYSWAFDRWRDVVWQEFDWNGVRVGAPQMIVITRQSPNYHEPCSIREPLAIWNQAWFCSLRTAQGLYRYARRTGNGEYLHKARLTKELALQFPQEDGLFDSVVGVENVPWEIDGKTYFRGGDWKAFFLGNSNRNPVTSRLAESPCHILDMSWTALHMLSWYAELEKDERLLQYAVRYADRLLRLQDDEGFFPAWIDRSTGAILPELRQSPESAASVTLLLQLHRLTGDRRYLDSALACADALIARVMPDSRWEDFETYWSCSRFGQDMQGRKYPRNEMYKQCSLSPFYMAQALYECYLTTEEERYLRCGERCLDELLMFQSSYQPSYLPIAVVGGFGVMNGDAELNDSRQSMFAELILQYGRLLNRPEYLQRGWAALRASFTMMYCPENPAVMAQWEKRWPFLNETDYGFMMENYGHNGYADDTSLGIGEFTIYDWGNGAAAEAVMRINDHFGLSEIHP